MIDGPILLTGAGGDIGIALVRVLKETWPSVEILGADCQPDAVGAAFVDRFFMLPRADCRTYVQALKDVIEQERASLVVPLAEAELARLLSEGLIPGEIGGAQVVCANTAAIETGLDKWATNNLLIGAGLAAPESGLVGQHEPGDFDLIIKPRSGQGSKGLLRLARSEFENVAGSRQGYIWQRWLKDDAAEFTCGVARFQSMPTRSLAFRRRLSGGLTGSGEVVYDQRIVRLCEDIAELLELEGAVNIQLRMDQGQPLVFEINPRLSSTVGFRHRLGFCDAIWSIQNALGQPIAGYDPPPAGTRIDRVAQEVIRPPALS